jgi:uroporphyrinogen decarboxylase
VIRWTDLLIGQGLMQALTSRERVLLALNHTEADHVPVDFGGTTATSIFAGAYEPLKKFVDLALAKPIKFVFPHCDIVRVDEEIVDRLGSDVFCIQLEGTNVLDGAAAATMTGEGCHVDEYGVLFKRRKGSCYSVVEKAPFASTPDVSKIGSYNWPDPRSLKRSRGLKAYAESLRRTMERALVIELPGRFLSFGQNLCGFSEWMTYLATEPKFVNALMDKALEIQAEICVQILDALGDSVDIVFFADDLGTQQNLQISPKTYRAVIKPRQKSLFEIVKSHTRAKILLHSDGAVASIVPDLIEIGVDIINPVQPTCKGMDTSALKRDFGRSITFWGSIDTQHVMPFGTPRDVADEVQRRIDDLAPGGGFVLAAVHNIQPEVPPENILALFQTAFEYGQYS